MFDKTIRMKERLLFPLQLVTFKVVHNTYIIHREPLQHVELSSGFSLSASSQ